MSAVLEREPSYYQSYSPEYKAEALAKIKANGGNVLRTANELGIPRQTLESWLLVSDRFAELQQRKQSELASKYEANLHRLADNISETDLTQVPFGSKATAIGILTDKMLLLRGQPTSISVDLSRQDISITLQAALAEVIDITPGSDDE